MDKTVRIVETRHSRKNIYSSEDVTPDEVTTPERTLFSEDVTKVAGKAAHDINNFLTAVLGNLDLARSDISHMPETVVLLDEIEKAARKATELTRQLQSISRLGSGAVYPVELDAAVRRAVARFHNSFAGSRTIHIELCLADMSIRGDAANVEQCVYNLLSNAYNATARGGDIWVYTQVVDKNNDAHQTPKKMPSARLVVKDTGHGITDTVKARIFEPFYSSRASGNATGLGLTQIRATAAQSGALLWVESSPSVGTEFFLDFPIYSN